MILVVGGHSRNIGKTSVVANIIASLPDLRWTAIKITQFGHGVCSKSGDDCECSTDSDHPFAITRESDADSGTDTARFLAAGAAESLWIRTRAGELGFAVPAIKRIIGMAGNVIIESNSVMQFLRPDAFLVVLDPSNADFKASTRLFLDRADAFLLPHGSLNPEWSGISPRLLRSKPSLNLGPCFSLTSSVLDFIRSHHKVPSESRR